MTNQSSDFSFTLSPEAAASFHEDGVVILHSGKDSLFSSNQTGARIWRGVEQRRSLDSIVEELSGEYQIARTTTRWVEVDGRVVYGSAAYQKRLLPLQVV